MTAHSHTCLHTCMWTLSLRQSNPSGPLLALWALLLGNELPFGALPWAIPYISVQALETRLVTVPLSQEGGGAFTLS
jgi:hypothetical protein